MTEEQIKQILTEDEIAEAKDNGLTDAQIEDVALKRAQEAQKARQSEMNIEATIRKALTRQKREFDDLTNKLVYNAHSRLIVYIANEICLAPQHRKFEIDEHNKDILRFLLYYFNNCELAESVFPNKNYKLHNNLLIMGNAGTGKTLLMQIFAEYLRYTNNPNQFQNISVTQMTNHFTMHNNIDCFTYNEDPNNAFMPRPVNICLNDIGVENRPFYGIDTRTVVCDFLHARNEIWTQTAVDRRKFAHLTTNLTMKKLETDFADDFGRLLDRFKTYNIIKLTGESRR